MADRLVAGNAQSALQWSRVAESSGRRRVRQCLTPAKNMANARGLLTVPLPYGKARANLHPDLSGSVYFVRFRSPAWWAALRILRWPSQNGAPNVPVPNAGNAFTIRSEEHTSELQSLMSISSAVLFLK